jgi:hypothetical protein
MYILTYNSLPHDRRRSLYCLLLGCIASLEAVPHIIKRYRSNSILEMITKLSGTRRAVGTARGAHRTGSVRMYTFVDPPSVQIGRKLLTNTSVPQISPGNEKDQNAAFRYERRSSLSQAFHSINIHFAFAYSISQRSKRRALHVLPHRVHSESIRGSYIAALVDPRFANGELAKVPFNPPWDLR